jgi:hypothetical protein
VKRKNTIDTIVRRAERLQEAVCSGCSFEEYMDHRSVLTGLVDQLGEVDKIWFPDFLASFRHRVIANLKKGCSVGAGTGRTVQKDQVPARFFHGQFLEFLRAHLPSEQLDFIPKILGEYKAAQKSSYELSDQKWFAGRIRALERKSLEINEYLEELDRRVDKRMAEEVR